MAVSGGDVTPFTPTLTDLTSCGPSSQWKANFDFSQLIDENKQTCKDLPATKQMRFLFKTNRTVSVAVITGRNLNCSLLGVQLYPPGGCSSNCRDILCSPREVNIDKTLCAYFCPINGQLVEAVNFIYNDNAMEVCEVDFM